MTDVSRSSVDESQNANSCVVVEQGRNANSTQRTQTRTLRMLLLLVSVVKLQCTFTTKPKCEPNPREHTDIAKPFLIMGN
jgi:hypothetical protein